MKGIKPGERLLVRVDYPKSSEDIPRWAEEAGHKVVTLEKRDDSEWEIVLQKGEG
jgi:TusA-related sulfurtransferase